MVVGHAFWGSRRRVQGHPEPVVVRHEVAQGDDMGCGTVRLEPQEQVTTRLLDMFCYEGWTGHRHPESGLLDVYQRLVW